MEMAKEKKKMITEEQRNVSFSGMVQRTEGLRFGRLMLLLGHCPQGYPPPELREKGHTAHKNV